MQIRSVFVPIKMTTSEFISGSVKELIARYERIDAGDDSEVDIDDERDYNVFDRAIERIQAEAGFSDKTKKQYIMFVQRFIKQFGTWENMIAHPEEMDESIQYGANFKTVKRQPEEKRKILKAPSQNQIITAMLLVATSSEVLDGASIEIVKLLRDKLSDLVALADMQKAKRIGTRISNEITPTEIEDYLTRVKAHWNLYKAQEQDISAAILDAYMHADDGKPFGFRKGMLIGSNIVPSGNDFAATGNQIGVDEDGTVHIRITESKMAKKGGYPIVNLTATAEQVPILSRYLRETPRSIFGNYASQLTDLRNIFPTKEINFNVLRSIATRSQITPEFAESFINVSKKTGISPDRLTPRIARSAAIAAGMDMGKADSFADAFRSHSEKAKLRHHSLATAVMVYSRGLEFDPTEGTSVDSSIAGSIAGSMADDFTASIVDSLPDDIPTDGGGGLLDGSDTE